MADISSFTTFSRICDKSNTTGTASGAGSVYKISSGPYLLNFQNATVHLEKIFENSANQNPVLPLISQLECSSNTTNTKSIKNIQCLIQLRLVPIGPSVSESMQRRLTHEKPVYTANNDDNICQVMTIQQLTAWVLARYTKKVN